MMMLCRFFNNFFQMTLQNVRILMDLRVGMYYMYNADLKSLYMIVCGWKQNLHKFKSPLPHFYYKYSNMKLLLYIPQKRFSFSFFFFTIFNALLMHVEQRKWGK